MANKLICNINTAMDMEIIDPAEILNADGTPTVTMTLSLKFDPLISEAY